MFEYLRFRWKLGRLEREDRRLDKEYDAKIKAAEKRAAPKDEIENLGMEASHWSWRHQEIQKLHSQYLLG